MSVWGDRVWCLGTPSVSGDMAQPQVTPYLCTHVFSTHTCVYLQEEGEG